MLRITVEVVPTGAEEAAYKLAELHISTVGMGTKTTQSYRCQFYDLDPSQLNYLGKDSKDVPWVETRIHAWPRQGKTVWQLVERALGTLQITLKPLKSNDEGSRKGS
jgi:hypothetical protein